MLYLELKTSILNSLERNGKRSKMNSNNNRLKHPIYQLHFKNVRAVVLYSCKVWWISQSLYTTWVLYVQPCNYSNNFCLMQSLFFKTFQGRGGFGVLGHFDKHFVKNFRRKKPRMGKIFEFFPLDSIKTTFWMEILTHGWTLSGPFFPKSGNFLWFLKKGGGDPAPSPCYAPERRSIKKVVLKNFAIFTEKQLC